MVIKIAEGSLRTMYGQYQEHLFYDGRQEIIAMVMGDVAGADDVLCRVHSSCLHGHAFNSVECDCRQQMAASQQRIQQAGRGIIIWLDQEGKANGHFALLKSQELKRRGVPQAQAYEVLGFRSDARDFTPAAEVLHELGVSSICMLTNNPDKTDLLTRHGVHVAAVQSLSGPLVEDAAQID